MLRTEPAEIRSNIAVRRRPRTLGRLALATAIALVATLFSPVVGDTPVFAATIDQKRAEARRLATEIDENDKRISVLAEQYNGAVLRIAELTKNIKEAQARLTVAKRHTNGLRTAVRSRAAALYMGAKSGTLFPELDADNAQEVASRTSYAAAAAARDSTLISSLRTASTQLTSRKRDLNDARGRAQQESTRLANTKTEIEAANVRSRQLLEQTNNEIETLVRQEQERRRIAAEAAARAEIARREAAARAARSSGGGSGAGFGNEKAPTNLPAPTGAAAIAVNAAKAQLNKPYLFAAAGPDRFDCSGLTLFAWAKAGVSMAHFAATQYSQFPHVPISQLAPGDLLFFGSPIHHVGMYVGNGTMIEAPHTGAFVRYRPIYRDDYVGASRPSG